MAYTQAQWVADFREHLGDTGSNGWSDYQLINATRRAYEASWPDFWQPLLDTTSYTRYASVAMNTNIIPVPAAFVGGDIFNIYTRVNVYQQGIAFTATAGSTTFTTVSAHGLAVNAAIQLDGGSLPGGFANGTTYYIKTAPTSTTFTLSGTVGGAAITATSNGSGYVGALFTDNTYRTFNKIERGLLIDPLSLSNPQIRFTRVLGNPYELWIEGASQLAYPTAALVPTTVAGVTTFVYPTNYTPVTDDFIYFFASAPVNFTAGVKYYVINPTGVTFQLSATTGGAAIVSTNNSNSKTFLAYTDSLTLTGTDNEWFASFLRYQGEVNVTRERQRSGNLDRRAMAQRRLLAAQDVTEARSHRMRPAQRTTFRYMG